jgi:hypothetical protein
MKIDDGRLQEFMSLWSEQFGEVLSCGEAALRAQQLLALYESLLGSPRGVRSDAESASTPVAPRRLRKL